jgi:putative transposase
MHTPGRGDGALRHQRVSLAGSSYFLTLCSTNRTLGMIRAHVASALRKEICSIETDGHWTLRAAVIMPDHVHLFVRLAGNLPISRCVARLKAKTRTALAMDGLSWQKNFYEHRLRPDDEVEQVVRYIFLNPHRCGLANESQAYEHLWLGEDECAWFEPQLDDGRPVADWLR